MERRGAVAGLWIVPEDHRGSDVGRDPHPPGSKARAAGVARRTGKAGENLAVVVDQVRPVVLLVGEPQPFRHRLEPVHLRTGSLEYFAYAVGLQLRGDHRLSLGEDCVRTPSTSGTRAGRSSSG